MCFELTKNDTAGSAESLADEDELRSLARRNVNRMRDFRLHLLAFVVGTTILTATWALTEYLQADGWPKRFGDEDAPGTWHIWIFYVVGVWAVFVALKGVGAYGRRRPRQSEVDRELERMTSHG
jgi:2TM domain